VKLSSTILVLLCAGTLAAAETTLRINPADSLDGLRERLAGDPSIREVTFEEGVYHENLHVSGPQDADLSESPLVSGLRMEPGSTVEQNRLIFHTSDGQPPEAGQLLISAHDCGMFINRPHVTVRGIDVQNYLAREKWSTAVDLRVDHIAVEDCTARNWSLGFIVTGNHNVVRRCTADDVGGGVYVGGENATVENRRLFKNRDTFMVPMYAQDDTGIPFYSPARGHNAETTVMNQRCLRPSRRTFLQAAACGAALLLLSSDPTSCASLDERERPNVQHDGTVKAFPTAQGFGAVTSGGRGGRVIYVTNLDDAGPGSLRAALEAEGPRFVLFKVSGTIELKSNIGIREENSYVTVAGQTAPGDGIQLKDWSVSVHSGAHDVVIRFLRFRPGTGGVRIDPSRGVLNGNQIDGFTVYGNSPNTVRNVILDHCSMQWAVDENSEVYGNATDVTFQWCLIAEGALWGHEKGPHSMGMILGGWGAEHQMRVSVHHCLFAHHRGRNPLMLPVGPKTPNAGLLDFRNNVVYNWGGAQGATELGAVKPGGVPLDRSVGTVVQANLVNNVYLPGPDTGGYFTLHGGIAHVSGPVRIFLEGNYGPRCESGCGDSHWDRAIVDVSDVSNIRFASKARYGSDVEFAVAPVTTTPTGEVRDIVLANAGATRPRRDTVDARIVREVMTRTGKIGPYDGVDAIPRDHYPDLESTEPPLDSDNDGMPDDWERAHGFDPHDPRDGNGYRFGNGYTNLENYLNGLTGDPIPFGKP